jgi:DNA-binding MarR family transcriptional regulator
MGQSGAVAIRDPDLTGAVRNDALVAVVRTARVFAAITAESIAQAGERVTLPQLRVLTLVSGSGALSNTAVARALDIHISNASRLCDRLVHLGLLDRRDDPANRRQVELTLTESGRQLVNAVTDHRRHAFQRILTAMTEAEQAALTTALAAFADAGEAQIERVDQVAP